LSLRAQVLAPARTDGRPAPRNAAPAASCCGAPPANARRGRRPI